MKPNIVNALSAMAILASPEWFEKDMVPVKTSINDNPRRPLSQKEVLQHMLWASPCRFYN